MSLNDILPWISLIVAVVGVASTFAVMKYRIARLEKDAEKSESDASDEVEKIRKDMQAEKIAAEHGRRNIQKDLRLQIDKEHDIFTKRIDKTQEDLKEYKTKTDDEFKSLNRWMSSIDGKLKLILNNFTK